MPVMVLTQKESAFLKCAEMILRDECPPDRKHYLCLQQEDDAESDCAQCWINYMWKIGSGEIKWCYSKIKEAIS